MVCGQTGCGKSVFVLDLLEKEYQGVFENIVILCPTVEWNKAYKTRRWIGDVRRPKDKSIIIVKSRKTNPQKLTQLSSRSHPRHLVGKRTAQKDTIIDITSDSQVNSNFPYRWSPASLTFNNYFYLFFLFIYNVNNHK